MEELSIEEKDAVARAIRRKTSWIEITFSYAVYILPSLLFATYAYWKKDYIAFLVAYSALFIVCVWYLIYSFSVGNHLYSALKKYEEATNALKSKDKT